MKPIFFFIIMVLSAGLFVSCEEECLECQDHFYFDNEELEDDACEALHFCTVGDLVEISVSECDKSNYPQTCWEALVQAETCSEMKVAFKTKCDGKENSSNNTSNNNTTDPTYEDLCDVIRDDCGYDAISLSDCINDLMPRLGSTGRNCIDEAADNQDCGDVAECLNEYAVN